ncbi:MAG: hypothetical protein HRT83_05110 [Hyphomicrobiaceae bacterium]|nr:hypothetical protein [Hyphomicrobiaceae bacterium]
MAFFINATFVSRWAYLLIICTSGAIAVSSSSGTHFKFDLCSRQLCSLAKLQLDIYECCQLINLASIMVLLKKRETEERFLLTLDL